MTTLLVINPNISERTTAMMLAAARAAAGPDVTLRGLTAIRGPAMIVDAAALRDAAPEVVRIGLAEGRDVDGVIVAAFGDPGVAELRAGLPVPVAGIGEAAIREAAAGGRRFGIATTTPGLVGAIDAMVGALGLGAAFTGTRVPKADPLALAADPARQEAALAETVRRCLEGDGAEVVVIGGGPLSDSAARLRVRYPSRVVEPLPAAIRALGLGTPARA